MSNMGKMWTCPRTRERCEHVQEQGKDVNMSKNKGKMNMSKNKGKM